MQIFAYKGDANVKKFIHKFRLDKSVEYHLRMISAKGLVSVMQNYRTYGPGKVERFGRQCPWGLWGAMPMRNSVVVFLPIVLSVCEWPPLKCITIASRLAPWRESLVWTGSNWIILSDRTFYWAALPFVLCTTSNSRQSHVVSCS